MSYVRKTYDEWELITNYGYGEEVECTYDNRKEAKADLCVYRKEKAAGYLPNLLSVRLKKRRRKIA